MEWTIQRLRRYLGPVKVQVAFQGITDEGLQAAFHQEAVQRLALVEAIVFDGGDRQCLPSATMGARITSSP